MNYKWITASEINAWTEKEPRRAQELLPKLIIKLILASCNNIENYTFPSGDSIQNAGYDGTLVCKDNGNFVPNGESVWEMGTDKNALNKFREDFRKRTANPLGKEIPRNTFVFVTSRIWSHKISIAEEEGKAKIKSEWKSVIIIDANYLEHWLESCYSVTIWFADIIGKNIEKFVSTEEYWREWAENTTPSLKREFFLEGRQDFAKEVENWFISKQKDLVLIADSNLEALLFVISVFNGSSSHNSERFQSKTIIVKDNIGWTNIRGIITEDIITIPNFNINPGMDYIEKSRNIFIVNKYSPLGKIGKSKHTLIMPKRRKNDFEIALKNIGLNGEALYEISYKTKRNFSALYRRITNVPTRKIPSWINSDSIIDLVPALFLGCWDGKYRGDVKLVEELTGGDYEEYITKLSKWISVEETPIVKVDKFYMIVSISDMWDILWNSITEKSYRKFFKIIEIAFQNTEINSNSEQVNDIIYNEYQYYSDEIIEGLAISMIMLSDRDREINLFSSNSTKQDINNSIEKLFNNCPNQQAWHTLVKHLPLLIEASPSAVLLVIEKKIDCNDEELWALFQQSDSYFGIRSSYVHLLWALEKLAWEKDYAAQATYLLAQIDEKKFEYRLANTPINSLYNMFCLWSPQICFSSSERLQIIGNLINKYPYTGWRLADKLLPEGVQQISSNVSKPRWKEFECECDKPLTQGEYWNSISGVTDILMDHLTPDVQKWEIVISKVESFLDRTEGLLKLLADHKRFFAVADQTLLADKLGEAIYRNRKYNKADWSMPEQEIINVEKLYNAIVPESASRYRHLFTYNPYDLEPIPYDAEIDNIKDEQAKTYGNRKIAIETIIKEYGYDELCSIVSAAEDTLDLGKIIAEDVLKFEINWEMIFQLKAANPRIFGPIINSIMSNRGLKYINNELSVLPEDDIAIILCAFPMTDEILDTLKTHSCKVQEQYWRNTNAFILFDEESMLFTYVIDRLLENDRAYILIDRLAYSKFNNSEYLVKILQSAANLYPNTEPNGMKFDSIPTYDIKNIFEKQFGNPKINEETVAEIGLNYLSCFDNNFEPKCITNQLYNNPKLFIDLLTIAFRSDDSNSQSAENKAEAQRANKLFVSLRRLPGYSEGTNIIDEIVFSEWMDYVLNTSKQIGYYFAGQVCIGILLSYSPMGTDGVWPHEGVRKFMELNMTDILSENFIIGKLNQRGVYQCSGGVEELELAGKYDDYAAKIMFDFPKVAAVIRKLRQEYLHEARSEEKREMKGLY